MNGKSYTGVMNVTAVQTANQPAARDLAAMTLPELVEWRDAVSRDLAELVDTPEIREETARFNEAAAVIYSKASPLAQAVYAHENKVAGTKTFKLDGLVFKADVSTKVTWDQEKLRALAGTLTWSEVQHYFKIDFAVSEAIYKALPPGPIKDAITAARTVKYGDLRVSVAKDVA